MLTATSTAATSARNENGPPEPAPREATSFLRVAGSGLRAQLKRGGLGAGVKLGVLAALSGFIVAGLFEWNFGDEELLYTLYVLVGLAFAARAWDSGEA